MMKQRYEDKLISLESRIKETEQERDTVLSSLGKLNPYSAEIFLYKPWPPKFFNLKSS